MNYKASYDQSGKLGRAQFCSISNRMNDQVSETRRNKAIALFALAIICAAMILNVSPAYSATIPAIRVAVTSDAIYSISATNLATLFGTNVFQVQTWLSTRQIDVENMGQLVSAQYTSNDISFYAQGYSSRYSGQNIYWIKQVGGVAMTSTTNSPASEILGLTFSSEYRVERNLTQAGINTITDPDAEMWFWSSLDAGSANPVKNTLKTTNNLLGIVTGNTLTVRARGNALNANSLKVILSNTVYGAQLLGSVMVTNYTYFSWTTSVSSFTFAPTGNVLYITGVSNQMLVDNFSITYQRAYAAVGNELSFSADGHNSLTVTGFSSSNIEIYDVSNPWSPMKINGLTITGLAGDYHASFHPISVTSKFVAVAGGLRHQPVSAVTKYASNLRDQSNGTDFIAIAPTSLLPQAQQLATYRSLHGLGAMAVDVQNIYDEFNFGIRDPRAIRAFIGYAYRMWTRAPRYVVLVGQGSFDYRSYLGSDCLIPSLMTADYNGVQTSDGMLADLDGDGAPEIAIGRLPVVNSNQFQNVYAKILLYEAGGMWKSNAVAVADYDSRLSFGPDMDRFLVGSATNGQTRLAVERNYLQLTTTSMQESHDNLIASLNNGRSLFAYFGQGSYMHLGPVPTNSFFSIAAGDLDKITNSTKPVLITLLTCQAGEFGQTNSTLCKVLVSSSNAAVAAWGAGNIVMSGDESTLATPLFRELYSNGVPRFGDAMYVALKETAAKGSSFKQVCKAFNLLGDPALAVGNREGGRTAPLYPTDPATNYNEFINWAVAPVLFDQGVGVDPNTDSDGDGIKNGDEYVAGTDPLDADSDLAIVDQRQSSGKVVVKWNSASHRSYDLERCTNFPFGTFQTIGSSIAATPSINVYTDNVASGAAFIYRIRVK